MSVNPTTIAPESAVRDAAVLMSESDISILPVVESTPARRIIGVISDRDILERCVAAGHTEGCLVRDHMTSSGLETAAPDDDVESVIKRMAADLAHRFPIVDADGSVVGIITYSDIVTRIRPDDSPLRNAIVERVPGGAESGLSE